MTNTPLISVIIGSYNRASLLPRAVRSVYAQTYQKLEVIVIDDASTDETPAAIRTLLAEFPLLRFIRNERNQGNAESKNIGIRAATGEYIAFLDDDDEWMPGKLEKQLALLQKTGEKCASCGMRWIEDGVETKMTVVRNPKVSFENGGPPSTWLIHRSVFEKVGLLDPGIPMNDDGDFLVRANRYYSFVFVESAEYSHYYYSTQISSSKENKIQAWTRLLDRHEREFSRLERSRAYLKLATFSLIAGKKDFRSIARSITEYPSIAALVMLLILMLPGRISLRALNVLLDLMRYPKSYASRYA